MKTILKIITLMSILLLTFNYSTALAKLSPEMQKAIETSKKVEAKRIIYQDIVKEHLKNSPKEKNNLFC